MRRGPVRRGNLVSGALLAGLGVYIVLEARRWEYLGADGPGPGFFPLWYGLAMIALSLGLIATSVAAPAAVPARADARRASVTRGRSARALVDVDRAGGVRRPACKLLGFLVAFGLFTLFVAAVMYRRPLLPSLAVAVGSAARLLPAVSRWPWAWRCPRALRLLTPWTSPADCSRAPRSR